MRKMRRYVPDDGLEPRWVAVFAHGGYFVFGDLNLQDGSCRRLALAIPADILSVDFALAPEHTATTGEKGCGAFPTSTSRSKPSTRA